MDNPTAVIIYEIGLWNHMKCGKYRIIFAVGWLKANSC